MDPPSLHSPTRLERIPLKCSVSLSCQRVQDVKICLITGDASGERREGERGEKREERREDFKELVHTIIEAGKPTVGMVGQQAGDQRQGDIAFVV